MFSSTLRHYHLIRVLGKLCKGSRIITVTSSFSKSSVFKIFSVHANTQSRRFHIPLVWRAFSKSSVFVTEQVCPLWLTHLAQIFGMSLIRTMSIPCILTLRVWRWLQHPKQCLHQPKKKDVKSISWKWKRYLSGGFYGSAHVSKSKYFCSLLNVIVLKTPLRCSSVITCYS